MTPACPACGSRAACDADGYCPRCGMREGSVRHQLDLDTVAGASDRGRLRAENEDALWVGVAEGSGAAVVCDGISSAWRSGEAARLAAAAVGARLQTELDAGGSLEAAMRDAVRAAQAAVAGLLAPASADPPACTLVAAAHRTGQLVVAGVGDSRAYWLGARCRQLTTDDSWAAEQLASGRLSQVEVAGDPRASAVTRWIGRDAPDVSPAIGIFDVTPGGRVVLCTDGLSRYLVSPRELRELGTGRTPIGAAGALVAHALSAGGRDNVTVAVIDVPRAGGL